MIAWEEGGAIEDRSLGLGTIDRRSLEWGWRYDRGVIAWVVGYDRQASNQAGYDRGAIAREMYSQ